jgi:alpha-glucosidase
VKKGSVIPMMPVMQYIHEKKDYPLFIHIFPNYEDETAKFELYEDEGENLDYLKDVYSKTNFACTTFADSFSTTVEPEDKGFKQSEKRNIVLRYHLDKKPGTVSVDGNVTSNVDEKIILEKLEKDFASPEWSWNEVTKECWVKIPDKRKSVNISIK